jgi:hypothetical protein
MEDLLIVQKIYIIIKGLGGFLLGYNRAYLELRLLILLDLLLIKELNIILGKKIFFDFFYFLFIFGRNYI